MAYRVLFVSNSKPLEYIIGSEESDLVQLFRPYNNMFPVESPEYYQSILNHMPHTQWKEFNGDDTQILQAFKQVQQAQQTQTPK